MYLYIILPNYSVLASFPDGNTARYKIYYVEPASSAFDAQSAEIKELQMQMATLGIRL